MSNRYNVERILLSLLSVLLYGSVAACTSTPDRVDTNSGAANIAGAAGTAAGGIGGASAGTAGVGTAGVGTAGTGVAGVGTAGTGVAGTGTAGTQAAGAGAAGDATAGTGAAGTGTAGMVASGGTGVAGDGVAGAGTAGDGATPSACSTDLQANRVNTSAECAACLCEKCDPEIKACYSETDAIWWANCDAMIDCSVTNGCCGAGCYTSTGFTLDGPCIPEIDAAGGGAFNVQTGKVCDNATPDNACAAGKQFGACVKTNCKAVCNNPC